ncbi:methyltransferase domain-containing protein [Actinomadura sp. 6K520]|uniref:methyltransferase domain-containing protein n=1 Tax=Actinomadura sp. 6K520 TaxID=2530364 RepID=UPI00105085F1|nr:methyltransferase domain-containing protein [Actinomadura sp. 6K520]TDE33935.1 methyltransferase domain-containing protein [Actinomadura sp. 6K520]
MTDPDDRRPHRSTAIVDHYGALARAALEGTHAIGGETCSSTGCGPTGYDDLTGLPDGAVRASLGCGNPVAVADLRPGETVLDLGSGGGIDVLMSARRIAPGGLAYGLDASPDMLALAAANADQAGLGNVRFLRGHIEDIPLPDAAVDVVISNCVINLSADKPRVLAEAFRVLRPGGRLGISDMIADDVQADPAEPRHQCAAQALTADAYLKALRLAGFTQVTITGTGAAQGGVRSAIVHATKPDRASGR